MLAQWAQSFDKELQRRTERKTSRLCGARDYKYREEGNDDSVDDDEMESNCNVFSSHHRRRRWYTVQRSNAKANHVKKMTKKRSGIRYTLSGMVPCVHTTVCDAAWHNDLQSSSTTPMSTGIENCKRTVGGEIMALYCHNSWVSRCFCI